MPVEPYKRTPQPPTVALLQADATLVDEHGEQLSLDRLPDGVRVWASYETGVQLLRDGFGEALCWNGEEIRWRHRRFEDGWKRRASDVALLRTVFPVEPEQALRGLVRWRDWLARYGASPTGTTGSAAWSLLRARLAQPLWTSLGDAPPLKQTLGGRQQLGSAGAGDFRGQLEHWDLPAAYASELARLPYGGRWYRGRDLPVHAEEPAWWARDGRPVFCSATVTLGRGFAFGPLPRRPRRRVSHQEALLFTSYPEQGRLSGVWTWQEIERARCHGVVHVREFWVHVAGERPFLPWWDAVVTGRRMPGLAGGLAKMTGNALWGQFCIEPGLGERTIRGRLSERRGKRTRGLEQRRLRGHGGRPPAHDLAETVSGRVRAQLHAQMERLGPALLSAHTDGVWLDREVAPPLEETWRRDKRARRLELLGPQVLRYTPLDGEPVAVVSGVPPSLADETFDQWWRELVAA